MQDTDHEVLMVTALIDTTPVAVRSHILVQSLRSQREPTAAPELDTAPEIDAERHPAADTVVLQPFRPPGGRIADQSVMLDDEQRNGS